VAVKTAAQQMDETWFPQGLAASITHTQNSWTLIIPRGKKQQQKDLQQQLQHCCSLLRGRQQCGWRGYRLQSRSGQCTYWGCASKPRVSWEPLQVQTLRLGLGHPPAGVMTSLPHGSWGLSLRKVLVHQCLTHLTCMLPTCSAVPPWAGPGGVSASVSAACCCLYRAAQLLLGWLQDHKSAYTSHAFGNPW